MTSDELRAAYLGFFEEKGHKIIPSSSLIPRDDPTLLLTTAGMVQFKPYFLGKATPPSPRLASCQKCFRTTDIDSVGDATHLTFFEMLGNFSIGNYFKKEAIAWAWEFVTERIKIPPERMRITIFTDDDESFDIWRKTGIPESRIVRLGEEDNFWGPAGSSGPCGPCSEIHYDFGEEAGCGKDTCGPGCECGRFSEIWNLVFTQYNQDESGKRTPLPKPNIDTGMGLERTAAVIQGKRTVYETDRFLPLLERISRLTGTKYGKGGETDRAMRVIAEHSRGIAFLISDGVIPSNEGRGYVLRRLLRRTALFGRRLGLDKPFLSEMAKTTIDIMKQSYPELLQREDFILNVTEQEEARFSETLSTGLGVLDVTIIPMRKELADYFPRFKNAFGDALSKRDFLDLRDGVNNAVDHFLRDCRAWDHSLIIGGRKVVEETLKPIEDGLTKLKNFVENYDGTQPYALDHLKQNLNDTFNDIKTNVENTTKILSGLEAFILHDTYGFLVDLTKEIAAERGLSVDLNGFEKEMAAQRERARAKTQFISAAGIPSEVAFGMPSIKLDIKETPFVGYHSLRHKSVVIVLSVDDKAVNEVSWGREASVVLEATPFYGEMGGQVGDTGVIRSLSGKFMVTNTIRVPPGIIVHQGRLVDGSLAVGDEVEAEVDVERRLDIARNHTATHLLQFALRQVLGEHVQQRGSVVAPDRLRFDFSHLTTMTPEEISKVQHIVNEKIRQNLAVRSFELPYKQAVESGAIALFEEKYGEMVRVLNIGEPPISAELCGGTHVSATGEIGFFIIDSETSVGAGLRRIEAVTGRSAEKYIEERLLDLSKVAKSVGAELSNVVEKVDEFGEELKNERKQRLALEKELALKVAESLVKKARVVDGVKVLAARVPPSRVETLREMGDFLREKLESAVLVLGSVYDGRPVFLAAVTPDLVAKGYNAGDIIKKVAAVTGGGGGGKATLAQAGGKDKEKLDEALRLVKSLVKNKLT